MDILTKGTPARLEDVPTGQCFAFEAGNQIAIGIKIAYPNSPDSRVFVLTPAGGQPPAVHGPRPTIVYEQPLMAVVIGAEPSRLRNGVGNPQPGHVMQFGGDVYIGFLDEHNDPSAISLKTGLINPNRIDGPAAVFETWEIVLRGDGEPETVFTYKPAAVSRAA
jgi:hypothetical protein